MPAEPTDFTPVETGWNAVSVASLATTTGSWITVRGARRLTINILSGAAGTVFVLAGLAGQRSTARTVHNAVNNQATLGVGTYSFSFDILADEVAIMINNTSGGAASYTVKAQVL